MLTATQIGGFAGAGLAGAAYVPQISHLVGARCSAGISRLAFGVWLLASLLTTARAIALGDGVFIVLGGIQIVATALVLVCAIRYKDSPCPVHLPGQPAAKTAAGTSVPGEEPGSRRPRSRALTEFQATYVEETTWVHQRGLPPRRMRAGTPPPRHQVTWKLSQRPYQEPCPPAPYCCAGRGR